MGHRKGVGADHPDRSEADPDGQGAIVGVAEEEVLLDLIPFSDHERGRG